MRGFTLSLDGGGFPLLGHACAGSRRTSAAVQSAGRDGKAVVQNRCSACHGLNMINNMAGSTKEQWTRPVLHDGEAAREQADQVASYLATSFPTQIKPPAVVIPGPATVSIKEWMVATLGQRPHDPLGRPTAPSGGRGSTPTCWDGSIPRPAR